MPRPLVSAIIPSYNRSADVCRAVASVLAQDFNNLEVIVVDDGSTDDTAQALRQFDDRVRYVHQANRGPGAARNNGVRHARGEWLAFLDSDDVWLEGKLVRQLAVAESLRADVCFHDVSRGKPGEAGYIPRWTAVPEVRAHLKRDLETGLLPDAFALVLGAGHAFLTTTLLMRRSAFLSVGGMREWLLTNQDIDLYFQLFPRFKVAFVAESLAAYSPGSSRAFEVASRKAADRKSRGAARVHLDRSRALLLALRDRVREKDLAGAESCRQALQTSVKSLAGAHRRTGLLWHALLAYIASMSVRRASPSQLYEAGGRALNSVLAWPAAPEELERRTALTLSSHSNKLRNGCQPCMTILL